VFITLIGEAMDYEEFKRQLGKAGLSGREFADLLQLNRNSISNLAGKEKVPDHLAIIASLMGEMAEHKIDFRIVIERIDLKKNEPRGKNFNSN
jgi:plasmid maintenance system antidote protein VapI